VMVGGVLIGLFVTELLASYVWKPIRSLRHALNAAAHGDLDVRIGHNPHGELRDMDLALRSLTG
jgi:methyl-accepting chemotaxis protein